MNTFFDYYKALPKTDQAKFRNRIMNVCHIEKQTWYTWIRRGKVSKQSQKLIALELNQPITNLFPTIKN